MTKKNKILLSSYGFFRQDLAKRTIGPRGREVLDQLMPKLIAKIYHRDDINRILQRIILLLISIVSRTTYLELILESEQVLTHVIRLCAASPMIAEQLARHPLLLDELIDPSHFTSHYPLLLIAMNYANIYCVLMKMMMNSSLKHCGNSNKLSFYALLLKILLACFRL